MDSDTPVYGMYPPRSFGSGPRCDPPVWARASRFLFNRVTQEAEAFYATAAPDDIWRHRVTAVCRNGETATLMLGGGGERVHWPDALRQVFKIAHVERYVLSIEAWMSLAQMPVPPEARVPGDAADAFVRNAPAPVDDPARQEVILFHACDRSGREDVGARELVRGADGRVASLRDVTALLPGGGKVRSARPIGPLTRLF